MKNKIALLTSFLLLIVSLVCIVTVFAHSGRTDGSGGHRDNKNVSGLGYYHYHCGGYPAHLHSNGVCPYKSTSSKSSSTSSTNKYDEAYNEGSEAGYELGYDDGYNEGHKDGYDEGLSDGYDKGHDEGYKDRIKDSAEETKKELKFLFVFVLAIFIIVQFVKFIKKRRK